MKKQITSQQIWETSKALSTKIQQASFVDKNNPKVQYPWVTGFMESLLKNLPSTPENLEYLDAELKSLERYLAQHH